MARTALQTKIEDTGWVSLPLREGVAGTAQYRVRGGVCTYRFSGTTNQAGYMFEGVLPTEGRPKLVISRAVYAGSESTRFFVSTAGAVQLPSARSVTVTIEESWLTS